MASAKFASLAMTLPTRMRWNSSGTEPRYGSGGSAAHLELGIVVEPHVPDEMLRATATEAGAATLHAKIEGLKFGWEPDGSHVFWDLKDVSDC